MDDLPGRNPNDLVTVCAACLTAACWQGEFYCQEYKTANVVQKTRAELVALDREHPDYWDMERAG